MQEELTYEQAMQRLDDLASRMEHSQIGIDEMADKLKEAQQLMKYCHDRLYAADQAIQQILPEENEVES